MKNLFLTFIALMLMFQLKAQDTGNNGMGLQDLLGFALENNPTLANARLDVDASKKKVWETTAIGLPQASAKVSYQNQFKVPEMNFGPYIDYTSMNPTQPITPNDIFANMKESDPIELGVKENVTADFTVSQLIFNGSYIVGLQASRTYKELAENNLIKSEQDIKEAVSNMYFLCLINQERISNLESNFANQEKIYKETKAMADQGFLEQSDADQMEIILNTLDYSLKSLKRQQEIFLGQLKVLIGFPVDKDLNLKGTIAEFTTAVDPTDTELSFVPQKNIDLQLINTQVKLSDLNLKNIKAGFLPVISGFYNHNEQLNSPDFNFQIPDMIGVNLELPIFSSGMRLSQVSQARIELDKTMNNRKMVQENLQVSFLQNRSDYFTALDKYLNEKKNLELSERILDKTQKKYHEGIVTSMELTNAQNQFQSAQNNYYQAIYDVLSAKTKLNRLLGNI